MDNRVQVNSHTEKGLYTHAVRSRVYDQQLHAAHVVAECVCESTRLQKLLMKALLEYSLVFIPGCHWSQMSVLQHFYTVSQKRVPP